MMIEDFILIYTNIVQLLQSDSSDGVTVASNRGRYREDAEHLTKLREIEPDAHRTEHKVK